MGVARDSSLWVRHDSSHRGERCRPDGALRQGGTRFPGFAPWVPGVCTLGSRGLHLGFPGFAPWVPGVCTLGSRVCTLGSRGLHPGLYDVALTGLLRYSRRNPVPGVCTLGSRGLHLGFPGFAPRALRCRPCRAFEIVSEEPGSRGLHLGFPGFAPRALRSRPYRAFEVPSADAGDRTPGTKQIATLFTPAVAAGVIKEFHVAHEACRILPVTRSDFELVAKFDLVDEV